MPDPTSILAAGVEQGLHPGAQLFVSLAGRTVIDFACGEARPGIALRNDSLMQWFSAGKPLTAICLARLYETGDLLLDDKVARFIPEFAAGNKDPITVWHLLTHTAGFRGADAIPRHLDWADAVRQICEAPIEPDWRPGETAGYSTQASWFILAEIIRRITGQPFPDFIRNELLLPLGMTNTWLSLSPEQHARYGEKIALMFDTAGGTLRTAPLQDAAGMAICRPGASARGPIRELASLYRMLLCEGVFNGRTLLQAETVSLFVKRHRIGLYDRTFAHTLDYGLGFIINSNRYGAVPYGYGRWASEPTFGHSGAQSSCAFADPTYGLIAAWVTNGMPGERAHQERQRAINNAIYEQLGIAQD